MYVKFLILGAGPAGLSVANRLRQKGINDYIVLEKEDEVGGLCRSKLVDGSPLDIGGGHFLDVKRKKVTNFLFEFMPENEWNLYTRDSRICFKDYEINHPFEANIWQLPEKIQSEYLDSIKIAGCNSKKNIPTDFVSWIKWKLGDKIAEDYMLPYNKKMFGDELVNLGTYWLDKLPNVSYDDTLKSCVEKKAYGIQPGHAQFYYPKFEGYGQLFKKMGEAIKDNVHLNKTIVSLNLESREVKTSDGQIYKADCIITTIPWTSFEILGLPDDFLDITTKLKHTSVEIRYFSSDISSAAHWIYYPEERFPFHRILLRKNFSSGSKGYWTETNNNRVNLFNEKAEFSYINEYAYPLNTVDKPQAMKKLLDYCRVNSVYGLGRWGEWEHYNSDVTVEKALILADELIGRI